MANFDHSKNNNLIIMLVKTYVVLNIIMYFA